MAMDVGAATTGQSGKKGRHKPEMNVTQENIPAVIPLEACYLGWQESLTLLAQLVGPEISE